MAVKNKKGQFTKEVKKTKDTAKISNDKEVAQKAVDEVQTAFAKQLQKTSDESFSAGYNRGRVNGFQEGIDSATKKGRKLAFSSGLIMGAGVCLIATILAIHFAGKV